MKNFITILLLALININCKAQNTNNTTNTDYTNLPNGCYLRDINNYLNPYVGEWKYVNGSTTLLIKLRKIVNYNNGTYSEDMLIGEYQYVENGIEKINTLANFSTNFLDQYFHDINGNMLKRNADSPACNDCGSNPRVSLIYSDPIKLVAGTMCIGINDIDTIKVYIITSGIHYIQNPDDSLDYENVGFTIPNGWYVLEKQ